MWHAIILVKTIFSVNERLCSIFVQTLNNMGAKKIGIVGVPPLGCCPSQIILGGSPSRECEPQRNQASILFNSKISKEIDRLNAEWNGYGSKFVYIDIYYNLLDLIQNPAFYGEFYLTICFNNTIFLHYNFKL
jgi:phospholipase/lecithinase/hemolysin